MVDNMTEQEYAEHVDRRYAELRERMTGYMEDARRAFEDAGYLVSALYDETDDEYRYGFAVEGNDLAETVDVRLTLAESISYGDVDGVSFALEAVSWGGAIVGGLTPYNYTPDCWVAADDAKAVSDRLALIEGADVHELVALVRRWQVDNSETKG